MFGVGRVTGMVRVPDLDFDATSAGMLVQGVAWLKGDAIREFLREQATFSTTDVMKQIQDLVVKEMNTELARGVKLSAIIDSSAPAGGARNLRAQDPGKLGLRRAARPRPSPAESPPGQTAPSPRAAG